MTTTHIKTLINGEPRNVVDVTDRGLAYGDGVFETMLCVDARVPLLSRHLTRLEASCNTLGIGAPDTDQWVNDIDKLLGQGGAGGRTIVKLILTRGSGGTGYVPPSNNVATRVVQRLDFKENSSGDDLHCEVLKMQLGSNRQLAGIKHLNRLEQVLAARELSERNLQEGLLCNHHGFLIEAVSSNVFLVFGDKVVTPKLDTAGVRGVMRDYLIEKNLNAGSPIEKDYVFSSAIAQADEILLCNSVRGVRRVGRLGDRVLEQRSVYERLHKMAQNVYNEKPGIKRA